MRIGRTLTLALAFGVLLVAVGMAGVSAWHRADGMVDKVLMVALACAVVGAVHLLPALCRSLAVWPLWLACFVVAVHGHAGFLLQAGEKVAAVRQAPQAQALQDKREAIGQALASIAARPVAVVAAQIARVQSPERRQALTVELAESQKAAALRNELVTLAQKRADDARHGGVTDPVTKGISAVTGLPVQAVTLAVAIVTAALLELVGVVLWRAALRPEPVAPVTLYDAQAVNPPPVPKMMATAQPEPVQAPADPVAALREAVARGEVALSVRDIRRFLSCSQARASELRRHLVSVA
ncbi:hypothetical protein B9Z51_00700 [Limnohabitans sp. T6-5]|nr:hypothetical protein B9Z51_00700 [Limnohabitans sp. T6-5]